MVFRSHWAVLLDQRLRPQVGVLHHPGSRLERRQLGLFAPFDPTHRVDLGPAGCPGWGDSTVVVTPLTQDRVIAIGRLGGPAFLDSEIARLHHLAALVK